MPEFNPPPHLLRPRDYSFIPETVSRGLEAFMDARARSLALNLAFKKQKEDRERQNLITEIQTGVDPERFRQGKEIAGQFPGGQGPLSPESQDLFAYYQKTVGQGRRRQEAEISKLEGSAGPRQPKSLDELLTRDILSGELSREDAFKLKASGSPTLLGKGLRVTDQGTLEAIPGGPAATRAAEATKQSRLIADDATEKADRIGLKVDQALQKLGVTTAGLGGVFLSKLPGTTARDLRADLDTLKANLGFDQLQQMRNASKTGGALGQVSERELQLLTSTVANLEQDQSVEQLRQNLLEIKASLNRYRSAAERELAPEAAEQIVPQLTPEQRRARIAELRRKLGK